MYAITASTYYSCILSFVLSQIRKVKEIQKVHTGKEFLTSRVVLLKEQRNEAIYLALIPIDWVTAWLYGILESKCTVELHDHSFLFNLVYIRKHNVKNNPQNIQRNQFVIMHNL